ncbi:MAG: SpoIID/LytB domain-containing protein [Acidobacteriota bacterium]
MVWAVLGLLLLATPACGKKKVAAPPAGSTRPAATVPSTRRPAPDRSAIPAVTDRPTPAVSDRRWDATTGPSLRVGILVDVSRVRLRSQSSLRIEGAAPEMSATSSADVRIGSGPRTEPAATAVFRIQVASFREKERADALVRALLEVFEATVTAELNESTRWYAVFVGDFNSSEQANNFLPETRREGFADAFVTAFRPRLADVPATAGETLVVSGQNGESRSASELRVSASGDSPVEVDGKPYRGSVHIFKNTRGRLTVVNEIALEWYLRGVVPNELSPFSFPEIEALKAQAVAARTFALRNLGQFERQERFDLYSTDRSQVYRGIASERPLSDQAVAETAGVIVTHEGRPISAMYSSTCGGHTEDFEAVFGGPLVPYLRGVPCLPERKEWTARDSARPALESISGERGNNITARLALLSLHGILDGGQLQKEALASPARSDEILPWLRRAAKLARRRISAGWKPAEPERVEDFVQAVVDLFFGQREADILVSDSDARYLLQSFADSQSISPARRRAFALLAQRKLLVIFPDGALRPQSPVSRRYAFELIHGVLDDKKALGLQQGEIVVREGDRIDIRIGKKTQRFELAPATFFFNRVGGQSLPAADLALVGGESATFLVQDDRIALLEVELSARGTASDRFSAFANWELRLTRQKSEELLARLAPQMGRLVDLQPTRTGVSGRVIEMNVVGSRSTIALRGGRIRSALGLRDILFVLDREVEADGTVAAFVFRGKGWGHGVGMCQVGAYGLARSGYSFSRILQTYYTGVKIEKAY